MRSDSLHSARPDEKILLALDEAHLDQAFREVPADYPPKEFKIFRNSYPTVERSLDGKKIWLSRLEENDPRRTKSYEVAHARWIPEDPWSCVQRVWILSRSEDSKIIDRVRQALRAAKG